MTSNALWRKRSFVIMTAMPPTRGHKALIDFAKNLTSQTVVVVCTQPSEPYGYERFSALREHYSGIPNVDIFRLDRELEQNPDAPGFWDMWRSILVDAFGVRPGDLIVASEHYGKKLADVCDAIFIPFDIDRQVVPVRATDIRVEEPNLSDILPEFIKYLVPRVTIFGAESNGKTSLALRLGAYLGYTSVPEWARGYLEAVGPELNREKMEIIAEGQAALQRTALGNIKIADDQAIFFDTDLYSTIGYWRLHEDEYGPVSDRLMFDIRDELMTSDLYVILPSDIEFEEDQLRYGGDRRESDDQFWIDLAEEFGLNYVVINRNAEADPIFQILDSIFAVVGETTKIRSEKISKLVFEREVY